VGQRGLSGEGAMMSFFELLSQIVALLQREGRVSYRAMKREFGLDDDFFEDLKGS
jgi:hypothetical protein